MHALIIKAVNATIFFKDTNRYENDSAITKQTVLQKKILIQKILNYVSYINCS